MFPCLFGSFMLHIPKCIVCIIPRHQLSAPASRTCFMLLPLGFQTPEEDVFRPQNISKKPCHKVLGKTTGYILVLFMIRNVPSPNVTLRLKRWVSGHSTNFNSTKDGETYTYTYTSYAHWLSGYFLLPSKARNGVSSLAWYLGCWNMDDGAQHGCHTVETFRAVGGRGDAGVESKQCRKMCVLFFVFCFF